MISGEKVTVLSTIALLVTQLGVDLEHAASLLDEERREYLEREYRRAESYDSPDVRDFFLTGLSTGLSERDRKFDLWCIA